MPGEAAGGHAALPAAVSLARGWGAAAALTLLGAALRLATLHDLAFVGDEFWTLEATRLPLREVLGSFAGGSGGGLTMHLYLILMKPWVQLVGDSPLAVKAPSLIAGIALVPGVQWLGRRLLDREAALLGALMTAASAAMIVSARTARVYPILTAVALLSMFLFTRLMRRRSWRTVAALGLANAVTLMLSLNSVYLLLVQGVCAALQAFRARPLQLAPLAAFAASAAICAVSTLPFYSLALPEVVRTSRIYAGSEAFRPELLWDTFALNHPAAPLLVAALLVAGAWTALRRGRAEDHVLIAWALLPPLLFLAQRVRLDDPSIARYLLPTLPAHFLLAGMGLSALLRRLLPSAKPGARLAVALAVLAVVTAASPKARNAVAKELWPTSLLVERVREIARPDDLITYDFVGFQWLPGLERVAPSRPLAEVVVDRDLAPGGRLVIIAFPLPEAEPSWAEHFDIEMLGSPAYASTLFLLSSPPLLGSREALRRSLQAFLSGFVEAVDSGARLHSVPHRHYRTLMGTHELLAVLSERTGAFEERDEHARLATRYRELATLERRTLY